MDPSSAAVVDASAIAAVLFGEPQADALAARLDDRELLAPTLLPHEVASVCLKKLTRYPEQSGAIREAMALFSRLGVRQIDVPVAEVVEMAERKELTAYDGAYLWLARSLGCELVTLDRALAAAASR